VSDTFVLPYNSISAAEKLFKNSGSQIAAVIVEPIVGNMGLVMPNDSFLGGLRELCSKYGSLLIFDEVITGFRFHPGTYGQLCGIKPDIYVLGKIIGGGMPLGAIGGSEKIMRHLSPVGKVYQAGTLSGNPISLAAGLATLKILCDENPYPEIARIANMLSSWIVDLGRKYPVKIACMGGMFTIFFTDQGRLPENLQDVKKCSLANFAKFHRLMLSDGIYLPPSQFEAAFISAAHTEKNISRFCEGTGESLGKIFCSRKRPPATKHAEGAKSFLPSSGEHCPPSPSSVIIAHTDQDGTSRNPPEEAFLR
jgi:glutamate-1-semialdehyde 2,1-aminomutase